MKKKQTITVITKRDILQAKDFVRPDPAQTLTTPEDPNVPNTIFDPTPRQECAPETPEPQPCNQPDPCVYDDFSRGGSLIGFWDTWEYEFTTDTWNHYTFSTPGYYPTLHAGTEGGSGTKMFVTWKSASPFSSATIGLPNWRFDFPQGANMGESYHFRLIKGNWGDGQPSSPNPGGSVLVEHTVTVPQEFNFLMDPEPGNITIGGSDSVQLYIELDWTGHADTIVEVDYGNPLALSNDLSGFVSTSDYSGPIGTSASGDDWGATLASQDMISIVNNAGLLANSPFMEGTPTQNFLYQVGVTLPDYLNDTPKACIGSPIQMELTWWADNYFFANDAVFGGGTGTSFPVGSNYYEGAWRRLDNPDGTCVEPPLYVLPTTKLTFGMGNVTFNITMGDLEGYNPQCAPSTDHSRAGAAYFTVHDEGVGLSALYMKEPIEFGFSPNERYRVKIQKENNVDSVSNRGFARAKMWRLSDPEPDWQFIWEFTDSGLIWFITAGFEHITNYVNGRVAEPVKIYIDDVNLGSACVPAVSTSRLVTRTLSRTDQGYYYPPETSVYGYKNVYFDGILGRLGIDYDVSGVYIIPHLSMTTFSEVVADFYINPSLVLA